MKTVLQEAQDIIHGRRQEDYGHPAVNLQRIADLWTTYVGGHICFSPDDVAVMMIMVKIGRLMNGYQRDSVIDLCGYAALLERLREDEDTTECLLPIPSDVDEEHREDCDVMRRGHT